MNKEANLPTDKDEEALLRVTAYFSKEENDWIARNAKLRKLPKSYILREILWEKMKDSQQE